MKCFVCLAFIYVVASDNILSNCIPVHHMFLLSQKSCVFVKINWNYSKYCCLRFKGENVVAGVSGAENENELMFDNWEI